VVASLATARITAGSPVIRPANIISEIAIAKAEYPMSAMARKTMMSQNQLTRAPIAGFDARGIAGNSRCGLARSELLSSYYTDSIHLDLVATLLLNAPRHSSLFCANSPSSQIILFLQSVSPN
jgi:hypothetical protein